MKHLYRLVLLSQLITWPALAGDDGVVRPRLVPGGVDFAQGDNRLELLTTQQGLSVGTLSSITPSVTALPATRIFAPVTGTLFDKLAMGGYVAYSMDSYSLSSVLRNRETDTKADLSASFTSPLLGYQGTTALSVGYDWHHPSALFSPNTQTYGFEALDPTQSGMSMSLSWNHAITPNISFGGFATAQHASPQPDDLLLVPGNTFKLGAALGLKF